MSPEITTVTRSIQRKLRAAVHDRPPEAPIHGTWSLQQQSAVNDNAAVDADGLLSLRR